MPTIPERIWSAIERVRQTIVYPSSQNAMNAINVIFPYKHHGMWVFDDPRVGLVQELWDR